MSTKLSKRKFKKRLVYAQALKPGFLYTLQINQSKGLIFFEWDSSDFHSIRQLICFDRNLNAMLFLGYQSYQSPGSKKPTAFAKFFLDNRIFNIHVVELEKCKAIYIECDDL